MLLTKWYLLRAEIAYHQVMILQKNQILLRNIAVSPLGGVRVAGFVKDGNGVNTKRRILNRYTLVYILAGHGSYIDDRGINLRVNPCDVIIIPPGVKHWYGPEEGKSWDEIYICFEGPIFDTWYCQGCMEFPATVFSLKPREYWRDRLISTVNDQHDSMPSKMIAEAIRMQTLLADMMEATQTNVVDDIHWLENAKKALIDHDDLRIAAQSLGISYESFRKRFRKLLGMPPSKYRTAILMERACEMLVASDEAIWSIAEALGYCDEYHFSKRFSKTIGWSPSEYRARASTNR